MPVSRLKSFHLRNYASDETHITQHLNAIAQFIDILSQSKHSGLETLTFECEIPQMFIMPVFKCHTLRSLIFTSDVFTDDSSYYSNQSPSQFDAFCRDTINSSQFYSKLQVILLFLHSKKWKHQMFRNCQVISS